MLLGSPSPALVVLESLTTPVEGSEAHQVVPRLHSVGLRNPRKETKFAQTLVVSEKRQCVPVALKTTVLLVDTHRKHLAEVNHDQVPGTVEGHKPPKP